MQRIFTFYTAGILLAAGCCVQSNDVNSFPEEKLTLYFNPFIGTGNHGNTLQSDVYSFGQTQLSPDNGSWDGIGVRDITIPIRSSANPG